MARLCAKGAAESGIAKVWRFRKDGLPEACGTQIAMVTLDVVVRVSKQREYARSHGATQCGAARCNSVQSGWSGSIYVYNNPQKWRE